MQPTPSVGVRPLSTVIMPKINDQHNEDTMMQATVTWQGKVKFVAQSGTGHEVVLDGPADHGGENQGPRPMEMLLMGMGGCASFDVVSFLHKSCHAVTYYR